MYKENQNAPRPSEHPPVREKDVKTFRWDHRLQILGSGVMLNSFFLFFLFMENLDNRVKYLVAGRPGSSEVLRNPLTRWDVSSIPANGIFLTKN